VADVTEAASEGELGSTVGSRSVCVAYVFPSSSKANDTTAKLVRDASGDHITAGADQQCFLLPPGDGRADTERRVQVSGSRIGNIELMVTTLTPTLSSESVTKFEAA
jgi:hypothetical protein